METVSSSWVFLLINQCHFFQSKSLQTKNDDDNEGYNNDGGDDDNNDNDKLGQIQELVKGGLENCLLKADPSRWVSGHASPGGFED